MTTATKPTVKEAKQVIDNNYQRYMDCQFIDPLALDIIGYSVANEVQIRDYLMGYSQETGDNALALKYVKHLIEQGIAKQNRHPFHTVLSALYYMEGETALAQAELDKARALKPTDSLLQLLTRIYGSGWPHEALKVMTHSVHPRVVAGLKEMAEQVIEPRFFMTEQVIVDNTK
jgi:hypothetical protein